MTCLSGDIHRILTALSWVWKAINLQIMYRRYQKKHAILYDRSNIHPCVKYLLCIPQHSHLVHKSDIWNPQLSESYQTYISNSVLSNLCSCWMNWTQILEIWQCPTETYAALESLEVGFCVTVSEKLNHLFYGMEVVVMLPIKKIWIHDKDITFPNPFPEPLIPVFRSRKFWTTVITRNVIHLC